MGGCDVIVAGGGPAGAAAALVLARVGRRVLLATGAAGDEFRVGESLPPVARPLLRDLGVLDRFLAEGHAPCYGNVSVWGGADPVSTDFIFDPNGHGWHLDRIRFDRMLREAARDAGAIVIASIRLAGMTRNGGGWQVALSGTTGASEEVSCRWLVDATGRAAHVARQAGEVRIRDDALIAFYCRFRQVAGTQADRDSRTAVEAGPDGWWYTARVPSGERVVAFFTDVDLVDKPTMLTREGFATSLLGSRYMRDLLSGYTVIGRPRGVDAGTGHLDAPLGDRWVAVGDAALSFDPLSSQGLVNALFTGLTAGRAVDRALDQDPVGLADYRSRLAGIERAYRRNREIYYAAEQRWADRPFWRRRTPGPPPGSPRESG